MRTAGDLAAGARALGVSLPSSALDPLLAYLERVFEARRRLSLTAVRDLDAGLELHLLDSLAGLRVLDALGDAARVVDVGTGAGFPGVALASARPGWRLCLVEATRRKADFVASAVRDTGLVNVEVWCERAETLGRDPGWRETFDGAAARALAPLAVVAELTLPFVRPGGVVAAYKGSGVDAELPAGRRAAELLGGTVEAVDRFALPWSGAARTLVVLRKVRTCPPTYPRRPGIPAKRPLGA